MLAVTVLFAGLPLSPAQGAPDSLYGPDPQHLWNRLHSALTPPAPARQTGISEILDPLVQPLLPEGDANREAVALLEEFAAGGPKPEVMSALQRALMQRDLLALFHQVSAASLNSEWNAPKGWAASARKLAEALARAIRHAALTAEEIRALPDNWAAAVKAPGAVTEYDSAHPGPFLPKELLERGGPWILLQTRNTSRVAGDFHFRTFGGQSSFEVRMRHPEGRAAGEAYLKALAGFTEPWVYDKSAEGDGAKPIRPQPNPATPQFPPGTMWALVRRAVLADKDGQPVVSPLVESVQVRVYRLLGREEVFQLPAFQKEAEALEKAGEWEKADSLVADNHQTVFEWEMRRGPLLSGGGFHLTGPEDLMHSRLVPVNRLRPVSEFCAQCHSAPPGIHSVQSRNRIFSEVLARPPEFHPAKGDEPDRITKERARFLPGWVLLQWLWKDGR